MKFLNLLVLCMFMPVMVWATLLDWSTTSTNLATLRWDPQTNYQVVRYTGFWTLRTNTDTGTNWVTTTNWTMFADVSSSSTNASMTAVPTNSLVVLVAILPGGRKIRPIGPIYFTNAAGIYVTNQPLYP